MAVTMARVWATAPVLLLCLSLITESEAAYRSMSGKVIMGKDTAKYRTNVSRNTCWAGCQRNYKCKSAVYDTFIRRCWYKRVYADAATDISDHRYSVLFPLRSKRGPKMAVKSVKKTRKSVKKKPAKAQKKRSFKFMKKKPAKSNKKSKVTKKKTKFMKRKPATSMSKPSRFNKTVKKFKAKLGRLGKVAKKYSKPMKKKNSKTMKKKNSKPMKKKNSKPTKKKNSKPTKKKNSKPMKKKNSKTMKKKNSKTMKKKNSKPMKKKVMKMDKMRGSVAARDSGGAAYESNFFVHMPAAFGKGLLKIDATDLGSDFSSIEECQKRCFDTYGNACIYAQWKKNDACFIAKECSGAGCGDVSEVNVKGLDFNRVWCKNEQFIQLWRSLPASNRGPVPCSHLNDHGEIKFTVDGGGVRVHE